MNDPSKCTYAAVIVDDLWMRTGAEEAAWLKEYLDRSGHYTGASIRTIDLGPLRALHEHDGEGGCCECGSAWPCRTLQILDHKSDSNGYCVLCGCPEGMPHDPSHPFTPTTPQAPNQPKEQCSEYRSEYQ